MSKPSSRPKSGKGKIKKEKPKPPKVVIKELTEQNEQLTQELNTLRNEAEDMKNKVTACNTRMLTGLDKKTLQKCFGITEATDPLLVPMDTLLDILGKLIVKKQIQDVSVEARCEELEKRVTDMSLILAKNTKKTLAYELGLEDLAKCTSLEKVQDKVYDLQYLAGQAYHDVTAVDPVHVGKHFPVIIGLDGSDDKPTLDTLKTLENVKKLNLAPPMKKYPGITKVKDMHNDLKLYLMKDLSQEKASGADWRMFAERVGISEDQIEEWKSQKLYCAMGQVFDQWCKDDGGATVRLLHRHLKSPQMRCTILAKRVSDFYEVD